MKGLCIIVGFGAIGLFVLTGMRLVAGLMSLLIAIPLMVIQLSVLGFEVWLANQS